jgi:hypothetical protein
MPEIGIIINERREKWDRQSVTEKHFLQARLVGLFTYFVLYQSDMTNMMLSGLPKEGLFQATKGDRKMKKTEIIDLIYQARANCDRKIDLFSRDKDPQVVEFLNKEKGKAEAYTDVLHALEGSPYLLKIAAEK